MPAAWNWKSFILLFVYLYFSCCDRSRCVEWKKAYLLNISSTEGGARWWRCCTINKCMIKRNYIPALKIIQKGKFKPGLSNHSDHTFVWFVLFFLTFVFIDLPILQFELKWEDKPIKISRYIYKPRFTAVCSPLCSRFYMLLCPFVWKICVFLCCHTITVHIL